VARDKARRVPAGSIVFSEGDTGDVMYVVVKGLVQVYRDGPSGRVVLGKIEPGSFFGEMALLGTTSRTATAMALSDSVLAAYAPDELESLLEGRPEVGARMIRQLVTRLKETTDQLMADRKKRLGSW